MTASDAGAVAARVGFKYQDHIAVQFALEMIANHQLTSIQCETLDDIVLLWNNGVDVHEYIQVKTTEADTKWNLKEITKREPLKKPTSLVEKSLLCEKGKSPSRFRIISKRDVNKKLYCLTLPLSKRIDITEYEILGNALVKKYKTMSENGNNLQYWAKNATWDVTGSMNAVIALNHKKLMLLAEDRGVHLTQSFADTVYDRLLKKMDDAALASRITAPDEKSISRDAMLKWWQEQLNEASSAAQKAFKPYRAQTDAFFIEICHIDEVAIIRAMTGYDASFEMKRWRSIQLAKYLADWLPEIALKASELVDVRPTNLRKKTTDALKSIERQRQVSIDQLFSETLLHAILRHKFKSEPIACKIFANNAAGITKSCGNAHIIHLPDRDELWLGRTQLSPINALKVAYDLVIKEISATLDPHFLAEERNLIVALREPTHLLSTHLEPALNPHASLDQLVSQLCIPVMLAYESAVICAGFCDEYKDNLKKEVEAYYAEFKTCIPESVKTVKIHVFFIPLESIEIVVNEFKKELGV